MSTSTTDDDYGGWIAKAEQYWRNFALLYPIVFDDGALKRRAIMSLEVFDALAEYSFTLPTGAVIGKRWKRCERYPVEPKWFLGQYSPHDDPARVRIDGYEIYIREAAEEPREATQKLIEKILAARGTVAALHE